MVIEWLKFKVAPQFREKFIKIDEEIWTATLSQCDGHLGKEIWIDPKVEDEIILVTHWESKEHWKKVSQQLLQETEEKFAQAMGKESYKLIEEGEFQVRKFRVTSN